MVVDTPLGDIERLEKDVWEAADQLRANSKLTSSEYCMPVLGVIFLRHAANRFEAATRQIQEDPRFPVQMPSLLRGRERRQWPTKAYGSSGLFETLLRHSMRKIGQGSGNEWRPSFLDA
jgi:type I restriction-modification system DNA methylase subunit